MQDDTRYANKPWNPTIAPPPTEHLSTVEQPEFADFSRLFPPRFGFTKRPLSIYDVFAATDLYPDARYEVSGGPAGYSGATRYGLGQM